MRSLLTNHQHWLTVLYFPLLVSFASSVWASMNFDSTLWSIDFSSQRWNQNWVWLLFRNIKQFWIYSKTITFFSILRILPNSTLKHNAYGKHWWSYIRESRSRKSIFVYMHVYVDAISNKRTHKIAMPT